MEERTEYIAEGRKDGHTYRIAITWAGNVWERISPHPATLVWIDLSGTSSFGSIVDEYPLESLLEEEWTERLKVTNSEWLRNLARQEQEGGRVFTPDEIFDTWKARTGNTHGLSMY